MKRADENSLTNHAIAVLQAASNAYGIKATSEVTDNYNRVWARDSAVAALAIISNQIKPLYPSVKASILTLQKAASVSGQIPSNVMVKITMSLVLLIVLGNTTWEKYRILPPYMIKKEKVGKELTEGDFF